jgi:nucleoid-associated protein YgaU
MATQADVAQALQAQGVNVFGLKVQDQGGMTQVSGTVQNPADKQKADRAIAALGNTVRSAIEVQVPVGSSGASANASGARSYTVKAGDTLSKIAKEMYGDANKWHAIHQANRDLIPNPDLIHPGQTLTIPAE